MERSEENIDRETETGSLETRCTASHTAERRRRTHGREFARKFRLLSEDLGFGDADSRQVWPQFGLSLRLAFRRLQFETWPCSVTDLSAEYDVRLFFMGDVMVPPPGFEPGVAAPWGPPLFRRAPEASIKHYRFFLRISSAKSGQRNATYGQSPVVIRDAMVPPPRRAKRDQPNIAPVVERGHGWLRCTDVRGGPRQTVASLGIVLTDCLPRAAPARGR